MPFYKGKDGIIDYISDALWKHAKMIHPELVECVPLATKEQVIDYTGINILEEKKIVRRRKNVSKINKQRPQAKQNLRKLDS